MPSKPPSCLACGATAAAVLLTLWASAALAGQADSSSAVPVQGVVGAVGAILDAVPAGHRVYALGILATLAGWALHVRFGRDPVASAQRDALAGVRMTAGERAALKAFAQREAQAEELAEQMRAERERAEK